MEAGKIWQQWRAFEQQKDQKLTQNQMCKESKVFLTGPTYVAPCDITPATVLNLQ